MGGGFESHSIGGHGKGKEFAGAKRKKVRYICSTGIALLGSSENSYGNTARVGTRGEVRFGHLLRGKDDCLVREGSKHKKKVSSATGKKGGDGTKSIRPLRGNAFLIMSNRRKSTPSRKTLLRPTCASKGGRKPKQERLGNLKEK